MAATVMPSRAEQQLFNFFVNGGSFYDVTGHGDDSGRQTGCCYSYHGPAQSGAPGHLSTPINTHPAITFQTTSSGNGAISEASNRHNIGTKGHAVAGVAASDAYDGFGGVGLLGQDNFGGLTVNRATDVTHGPNDNSVVTPITNAFTNAGVANAARFVETITNNTGSTITGQFGFFNNLGSDSRTLFVATNNGAMTDVSVHTATGNLWITSIQTAPSDPVITNVLGNNAYAKTQVLAAGSNGVGTYANGDDNPTFLYPITVAPGKTIRIVLFSILTADINFNPAATPANAAASIAAVQSDITLAAQEANLITNNGKPLPLNSPFFVGLTPADLATIINFSFAAAGPPSAGSTPNQQAVAQAANALGAGSAILTALSGLSSAAAANDAFDLLSGEIHASAVTSTFEDTRLVRDAILDRLRDGQGSGVFFGQAPADDAGFQNLGEVTTPAHPRPITSLGVAVPTAPLPTPAHEIDRAVFGMWGQAFGDWGRNDGDGNAASLDRSVGGFVIGADVKPNNWARFGIAGGFTQDWLSAGARLSHATVQSAFGALYGGLTFGHLDLRYGGTFAGNSTHTSRSVAFTGFNDQLHSRYDGYTAQGFGEAGYKFEFGRAMLEPIVSAAEIHIHTDGFTETGGSAALTGAARDYDVGTTVVGVRGEMRIGEGSRFVLRGLLGWQAAFGDVDPKALLAFGGGPNFSVVGVPLDRSSLVAQAGFDYHITDRASVSIAYSGAVGERAQDHAVKSTFEMKF